MTGDWRRETVRDVGWGDWEREEAKAAQRYARGGCGPGQHRMARDGAGGGVCIDCDFTITADEL